MTIIYTTSIEHITTTANGDKFLVSTNFANAYGDTVEISEDNAIDSYAKEGHTADQLMSIQTTELEID